MHTTIQRLRADQPTPDDTTPQDHRVLRRRATLPGSRAVVGGLLVTVAALLAWWSAAGAGQVPTSTVLVGARALAPGDRIQADDLRAVHVELPASLAGQTFGDPAVLRDAVALGPIGEGEIIQPASVAEGGVGRNEVEISFPIEPDWAVDASLRAGDRIDVFATYGSGPGARTSRVLKGVTVRRVDRAADEGLGGKGTQTLTLGLGPDADTARLVNATRAGVITVVRTTGSRAAPGGETFTLDSAGDHTEDGGS